MKTKRGNVPRWLLGSFLAVTLLTNSARAAAPVINWFQPANGTSVVTGNILLRAMASDSDGTVSFVDFYSGSNLLRRVSNPLTNSLYTYIWTNVPPGDYQLRAEAEDNIGERSVPSVSQITVTNVGPPNNVPAVAMLSPTNGAVFNAGSPITLTASASDVGGFVIYTDFYSGTQQLARVNGPTTNGLYNWVWSNPPAGTFQLRAVATDNFGDPGSSTSVQITFNAVTNFPPTSNAMPTATITQPANGAGFVIGSPILVRANVFDAEGALTNITFFTGSNLLRRYAGTLTNGFYSASWTNAPLGTHALSVHAWDILGQRGISASTLITVTNVGPANNLPAVSMLTPTNGAVLPPGSPVTLTASASDVGGHIIYVDFQSGTQQLARVSGPSTNNLYSWLWTNPPSGTFQLRAVATDNFGDPGSSAPVQVTFDAITNFPPANALPTATITQPAHNSVFDVGEPILIAASVADSDGTLTNIHFFAGTNLLQSYAGTLTNGIYYAYWTNAPAATHVLRVEADDNLGGHRVSATRQIIVTNIPPPNDGPVANMVNPTNGAVYVFGNSILLTASASDSDGSIAYLDFQSGTQHLARVSGPSTNALYSWLWTNPPAGMFQLRAVATDNLGAIGNSPFIQVSVSATNIPPTTNASLVVAITQPAYGATFMQGTSILVRANVTNSGSTLTNIEFLAGSTLLERYAGVLTNGIYSTGWSDAPAGTHILRVRARNTAGMISTSGPVLITVISTNPPPTNTALPVVSITQPGNGAIFTVGNFILVRANVTNSSSTLTNIEFLAGTTLLERYAGVLTNGVYSTGWSNAPVGTHTLRVRAWNAAGVVGTSAPVQISVITNNASPVATITQPTSGATFGAGNLILVRANVSDADNTINNIEFLAGTNLLRRYTGSLTNGIYTATWSNAPAGTHLLRVRARDTVGAWGISAPVQISVVSTNPPNVPPVVTWVSPANGLTVIVGNSILLRANASDPDGSIALVDFLVGTNLLGRVYGPITNGTYSMTWSNVPLGTYILHSEAVDNNGIRSSSDHAQIIVVNLNLPLIHMINVSPETGVELMISGKPGSSYIVECSTDTVRWIPINSGTIPASGSAPASDPPDSTVRSRFYRVVEVP